jgi:hypothetical protein
MTRSRPVEACFSCVIPLRGDGLTYAYARAYMNDAAWIDFAAGDTLASGIPTADDLVSPLPLPAGRNRRIEQPAAAVAQRNLDMNWLMPGQSVEMPVLKGRV